MNHPLVCYAVEANRNQIPFNQESTQWETRIVQTLLEVKDCYVHFRILMLQAGYLHARAITRNFG